MARIHPRCSPLGLLAALAIVLAGCAGPTVVADPLAELALVPNNPRRHHAAMDLLDHGSEDEAYLEALHRVIWRPGYTVEVREAALKRLEQDDLENLKRTIRQRLPQLSAWKWLTRLCEIIADREWVELSPALASSWAREVPTIRDETERPEYQALARLHGPERVTDVVFEMLVETSEPWQEGFRTRCWMLMHRLGHRDRIVALLRGATIDPADGMLVDLQRGAEELGIVPRNREEILWMRELATPARAAFWSQVVSATAQLPPQRRAELELRDLAVVVSAAQHEPELLDADRATLLRRLETRLAGQKHYATGSRFDAPPSRTSQRLRDAADRLTWGDLASMHLALRAVAVPEVVAHLFDFAERDRQDESTEYGGVIDLDSRGRFQVLEFPPRIRHHDQKFIAPQAMFDAAYTALFHYHFHAQRHRNEEYAGPGQGDSAYATNTRANCLVLTSVAADRLNVDFYRHGGVVVDLGTIERRAP